MTKWDLPHKCKVGLISENMTRCVNEGEQMQKKNLTKIQHPFMIKTAKLQTERNFLNLIKGVYKKQQDQE